jgi:hypothetical protein
MILGDLQSILQNKENKNLIINLLYKMLNIKFCDITFNGLEEFKSIEEYDFYLINFIGTTQDGTKKEVFIRRIKKGKIRESLFCICYLTYEKYFNNNSKEIVKKLNKITISEEKEKQNHINKVCVNLLEEANKRESINMEINFIEVSSIIEQIKKIKEKGWEKYIEINPKDILIVGVTNKY